MHARVFVVGAALAVSGCVTVADLSSGQVGCPPSEITISNYQAGFGASTWQATCRNQNFFCGAHGGTKYAGPQISCQRESFALTPESLSAPGCSCDDQCKGSRVCEQGRCVEPGTQPRSRVVNPDPATSTTRAALKPKTTDQPLCTSAQILEMRSSGVSESAIQSACAQ